MSGSNERRACHLLCIEPKPHMPRTILTLGNGARDCLGFEMIVEPRLILVRIVLSGAERRYFSILLSLGPVEDLLVLFRVAELRRHGVWSDLDQTSGVGRRNCNLHWSRRHVQASAFYFPASKLVLLVGSCASEVEVVRVTADGDPQRGRGGCGVWGELELNHQQPVLSVSFAAVNSGTSLRLVAE